MFLFCSDCEGTVPAMDNEPESTPLRLRWRRSWADRDHDFTAEADTCPGGIGRIYRHDTGGSVDGSWYWSLYAYGPGIARGGVMQGYEPSAREAAHRVEDAWFTAIRGSHHDIPPPLDTPEPSGNAYVAAKSR